MVWAIAVVLGTFAGKGTLDALVYYQRLDSDPSRKSHECTSAARSGESAHEVDPVPDRAEVACGRGRVEDAIEGGAPTQDLPQLIDPVVEGNHLGRQAEWRRIRHRGDDSGLVGSARPLG